MVTSEAKRLPDHLLHYSLKDAPVIWGNLMGLPDRFTQEGIRSFSVLLNHAQAIELYEQGYNVRTFRKDHPLLDHVSGGSVYLTVFLRSEGEFSSLHLDGLSVRERHQIDLIDSAYQHGYDVTVDLDLSGYRWSMGNGSRHGIKAYVESAKFTSKRRPEHAELDAAMANRDTSKW